MRRRIVRWGVAGLVGLAVGLGGAWWGAGAVSRRLVARSIPRPPDLAAAPRAVAQAIAAADREARTAGTAEAVGRLGMTYQANAFDDAARAAYALARRLAAHDARWPYYAGVLELMVGDNERAMADFEAALERNPQSSPAWVRLGELRFRSAASARAEEAFRRGLALAPTDPHGAVGLARILGDRGAWVETAKLLEASIRAHPTYGPAHRVLAQAYRALGQPDAAREHETAGSPVGLEIDDPLMRALYDGSSTASILVMQAKIAETWGDLDRTESLLRRAVSIVPDDRDARWALGRLLLHPARATVARVTEARSQLEVAIRLAPDYLNIRHDHAMTLAALGDIDGAVREWEAIVAQEPDHSMAHMSLGRAADRRHDYEAALAHYRRGLAVPPDTPYALEQRARGYQCYGYACLNAGHLDCALEALDRAVQLEPDFALAHYQLGQALLARGSRAEAARQLQLARQLDPQLPAVEEHERSTR